MCGHQVQVSVLIFEQYCSLTYKNSGDEYYRDLSDLLSQSKAASSLDKLEISLQKFLSRSFSLNWNWNGSLF